MQMSNHNLNISINQPRYGFAALRFMKGGGLARIVGHHGERVLSKPAQQAVHPVLLPLILQPELVLNWKSYENFLRTYQWSGFRELLDPYSESESRVLTKRFKIFNYHKIILFLTRLNLRYTSIFQLASSEGLAISIIKFQEVLGNSLYPDPD